MFIQIQTDPKEEYQHNFSLESTDNGYVFMHKKINEMIHDLNVQLKETTKIKGTRLIEQRSNPTTKGSVGYTNRLDIKKYTQQLATKSHGVPRKRVRAATSRCHQNEYALQSNIQRLEAENKKLSQKMRIDINRANQQITKQERRIQQLQNQQTQFAQAKKKLEKKYQEQRTILKKRNKEAMSNTAQLKELVSLMKKAVLEGGVLDGRMLVKIAPILGGTFAVIAHGGGHGFPKQKNSIPINLRLNYKKEQLNKAISQYVEGTYTITKMENLLVCRRELAIEKMRLEEEPCSSSGVLDTERISFLSKEIQNMSNKIQDLQTEAAHGNSEDDMSNMALFSRPKKSVKFVDQIVNENDRQAIHSVETPYRLPINAAPEIAYEYTGKLVRSLETDEYQGIIDDLIESLIHSKMTNCEQHSVLKEMEQNITTLTSRLDCIRNERERSILKWAVDAKDSCFKPTQLISLPNTPIASPPSPREREPVVSSPIQSHQRSISSESYLSECDSYISSIQSEHLRPLATEKASFSVFDRLAQASTRSSRAKMSSF